MINQFINYLHKKQELSPIEDRPYQFSGGAKERLEFWGVGAEFSNKIVALGSQYSYCYPEKRMGSILSGGLSLSTESTGGQKIVFPKYVHFDPSDPYGECSELARRAIIRGDQNKVFSEISSQHGKIKPLLVSGYAPTHFNQGDQRHYWVGLIPENLYPQDSTSMIVFDPSFKTITTLGESGYNLNSRKDGSTISDEIPDIHDVSRMISIGRLALSHTKQSFAAIFSEKENSLFTKDSSSVLGVTPDYLYSMSLLFARDMVTNKLHSVINLTSEDGEIAFLAIQGKVGIPYIRPINGQNVNDLSDKNIKLATQLLQTMDAGLEQYGIS